MTPSIHSKMLPQVLLALTLALTIPSSAAAEEAKKPQGMPVEAVEVSVETSANTLSAVGNLLANEAVVVTTEIAGKVKSIEFNEGERVEKGQLLLRLDPSVLAAERDRAKARLDLSAANYKRAEALLADHATSQRERDEAYAAWQLAEAELQLAEAQLAKTVLRAPFHGKLGLRMVSPGSYLPPGTEVTTIDDIDPLKVEFRVPEARAGELQIGNHVEVSVDAVPDKNFPGKVYALTPHVDINGRSITLRARVENPEGALLPGMFARVRMTLGESPDAIYIPEEAIIPSIDALMVFKVVEGKVEAAQVTTGERRKGEVEILSGLVAGDTVITAGHLKVRPGMPVMVMPTAAPKPAAKQGE